MKTIFMILAAAIGLSACGPVARVDTHWQQEKTQFPSEVGKQYVVNTGEAVYVVKAFMELKYAEIPTNVLYTVDKTGRQTRVNQANNSSSRRYALTRDSKTGEVRFCGFVAAQQKPTCFADKDGDKLIEYASFGSASGKVNEPFPLIETSKKIPLKGMDNFDLVYVGRTRDTVKFLYREFADDMIRANFSQDLEYYIENGQAHIQYRAVDLTVMKVKGGSITFKRNR